MPLGAHRHITAYDRVIVGSDGSPSAMQAVRRAHEIAAAGEASVVVVTAYDPGAPPEQGGLVGGRQRLYGKEAAREAMHRTVAGTDLRPGSRSRAGHRRRRTRGGAAREWRIEVPATA